MREVNGREQSPGGVSAGESREQRSGSGAAPAILVVEDDPEVGAAIVEQLQADGYLARAAHTAQHFQVLVAGEAPALALLGRLPPQPRGALDLLAAIRAGETGCPADLPVIMLGAPAHQLDLLRAFGAGTDDFLAHPSQGAFNHLELRARLQALLRRCSASASAALPKLEVGPLSIDARARSVLLGGRPIRVRPREYALLVHLAREPTRVFTKQELLHAVWGFQDSAHTRTLDSHACRLRGKLARGGAQGQWIVNVRGVGYRLV